MYWLRSFSLLSWLVATRAMMASAVRESSAFACREETAASKRSEIRRSFTMGMPETMYGSLRPRVQISLAGVAEGSLRWAGQDACPYASTRGSRLSFPFGFAGLLQGGGPGLIWLRLHRVRSRFGCVPA